MTFADGGMEISRAGERLSRQASNLGLFSKCLLVNSEQLSSYEPFKVIRDSLVTLDTPPLHFRAHKAWVLEAALSEIFGGFDVVFYADAGCEILDNVISKVRFKKILMRSNLEGDLAEQTGYIEKYWTKRRLLFYLDPAGIYSDSGQIQATWMCLKNNAENRAWVSEWTKISDPNLGLWQNPSEDEIEEQLLGLVEHRRDQSIMSILWKKRGLPTKTPYFEHGALMGSIRGATVPIQTIRNRSGETMLNPKWQSDVIAIIGLILNGIARVRRFLSKPNVTRIRIGKPVNLRKKTLEKN